MDDLKLTGITITESNGYGRVQYGSSTDYSTSTVKQVVDAWKNSAVKSSDTATARLITYDELMDNLGYEVDPSVATQRIPNATNTPTWVYNSNYWYWTISQNGDSQNVWYVLGSGILSNGPSDGRMVRPVLELNKSAEITKLAS